MVFYCPSFCCCCALFGPSDFGSLQRIYSRASGTSSVRLSPLSLHPPWAIELWSIQMTYNPALLSNVITLIVPLGCGNVGGPAYFLEPSPTSPHWHTRHPGHGDLLQSEQHLLLLNSIFRFECLEERPMSAQERRYQSLRQHNAYKSPEPPCGVAPATTHSG
jgi:hypothetical protein